VILMDILFNLIINLGFWLVIIILVLATIYRNSKKKQKKQSNQDNRSIGKMNTVQKNTRNDSATTRERNVGKQPTTTTQYSSSEHSESRKDYLDSLREKYQETKSDNSNAERREKLSEANKNPTVYQKDRISYLEQRQKEREKRNENRKKSRRRESKRRQENIKEYYDTNPVKLEKVQTPEKNIADEERDLSIPSLNQKNLRQSVIMKEILDKPKSLRR